jgi:hypothetical protein
VHWEPGANDGVTIMSPTDYDELSLDARPVILKVRGTVNRLDASTDTYVTSTSTVHRTSHPVVVAAPSRCAENIRHLPALAHVSRPSADRDAADPKVRSRCGSSRSSHISIRPSIGTAPSRTGTPPPDRARGDRCRPYVKVGPTTYRDLTRTCGLPWAVLRQPKVRATPLGPRPHQGKMLCCGHRLRHGFIQYSYRRCLRPETGWRRGHPRV